MNGKNHRPPARTTPPATPIPVACGTGSSEPDGVNIILVGPPLPRRRLHVTLGFAAGFDAAAAVLSATWFATRMRALDRRMRLTLDRERSTANAGEVVLAFAAQGGGSLAAEWLEEAKPAVCELAGAFEGAELKSVEVVSE
jgi:hypothetical protein